MTKLLFAALVAGFVLAGCGGGGQEVVISAPPALPVAPEVVPDVTFTQISTVEPVTPGETFRPVLIAVTCPLIKGSQSCMKTVPLGEIGFTSDLALQPLKLLHDGIEVQGFFNQEGNLYRFTPTYYSPVWQPGVIEIIAILSPTVPDGAKTSIAVQAADASFDKMLSVVSGETMVTVKALAYNTPAIITPMKDGTGFSYTCPIEVTMGCMIQDFNSTVNGAAASSEVQLSVEINGNDMLLTQLWTDSYGNLYAMTGVGYTVPPGGSIVVKLLAKPNQFGPASVWFSNFKSYSGDKLIEPIVPPSCSPVSSQYCKG